MTMCTRTIGEVEVIGDFVTPEQIDFLAKLLAPLIFESIEREQREKAEKETHNDNS